MNINEIFNNLNNEGVGEGKPLFQKYTLVKNKYKQKIEELKQKPSPEYHPPPSFEDIQKGGQGGGGGQDQGPSKKKEPSKWGEAIKQTMTQNEIKKLLEEIERNLNLLKNGKDKSGKLN